MYPGLADLADRFLTSSDQPSKPEAEIGFYRGGF
jgi:hypothetical protein